MIIYIKTQSGETAANSFLDNLKINNNNFLKISHNGKDIKSLFNISNDLRKIKKKVLGEKIIIADCGCLKILLILFLSFYNFKLSDKTYTTFYHHIIDIKSIYRNFSKSEIWKTVGLKLYLIISKVFNLKSLNFITVSKFTEELLVKNFAIDSSNIYVMWNQFFEKDFRRIILKNKEIKFNESKPFILIITSFKRRKNIKLIKELAKKYGNKITIVFPKPESNYEISIQNYFRNHNVKVLNNLAKDKLKDLYLSTSCVLVPSLFEGLSLVPLESMYYSTPMVLSDIDTHLYWGLPDSFYFNNNNISDLVKKLNNYLFNKKTIVDYSKYQILVDKFKKASEERSKNLLELYEQNEKN